MTRPTVAIALTAIVVVLALYARSLWFDFYWDDFDVLRPWTWMDLRHAWTGDYRPWATEGISFYRPLTSVYYATLSTAFGFHAMPMHVVPLLTIATAATLAGVWVANETGRPGAGMAAAAVYAAHPLTAAAIGPWIANQYQGLLVIALLAALLTARNRRLASRRDWLALAPWLCVAAWLKEDGMLLAPAVVLAGWARAAVDRDAVRPAWRAWLIAAGVTTAFIAWRAYWLPSSTGYGVPDLASIAANLQRAPRYALVWQAAIYPPVWPIRLLKWAFVAGAAVVLWRSRTDASTRREARVIATGLAVVLVMNLPLGLVSSENRWHAVGLGAVLIAAGALATLSGRRLAMAAALTVCVLGADAWQRIDAFAPCAADTRSHDAWAAALDDLPAELRAWLRDRDVACAAGRYRPFSVPMQDLRWRARTPPSGTPSAADAPR